MPRSIPLLPALLLICSLLIGLSPGCTPGESPIPQETPTGFEGVPLHPQAQDVSYGIESVEAKQKKVSFLVPIADWQSVLKFYQSAMREQGWEYVTQMGYGYVFQKEGKTVLIAIEHRPSWVYTHVRISDYSQPPDIPGFPDIPIHSQAVDVQYMAGAVSFIVPNTNSIVVIEFYTQAMKERDWDYVTQLGEGYVFRKGENQIIITISRLPYWRNTHVDVSYYRGAPSTP
jgi:hypothetical protein